LAVESEHYSTASSDSDVPGPVGVDIPAAAVVAAAAAAGEPVSDLTTKQLAPLQSPVMTTVPDDPSAPSTKGHTRGHEPNPRLPPPPVTAAATGLTIVPEKSRGNKKCDNEEEEEERHIFGLFGIAVKWP